MTGRPEGGDVLAGSQAGPTAVRGAGLRVAGYLAGVALSVGSAALLFRHLGVVDGGRYVTVLSLVGLFGGLTEAGLATIAVRELAAGTRDRDALLASLLGLRLALSIAAAVAAVAAAAAVGYPGVMVAGAALAGAGLVVSSTQLTLGASLQARLRFGWITALELLRQVVTVAGVVALVAVGAGLLPFLFLAVPASGVALAATAALVRGDMPLRPRFGRERWAALLRDVLPYAAATAVTAVYFRVAVIIVSLIASEEQTGYLGASYRVIEVLVGLPVLAVGAAFPIFARAAGADRDRLRYAVQRVADAAAIAGGLVAVGLFVGAPAVIDVVAGEDFEPAGSVLRIQAVGLFASFVAAVWGYALLSLRGHRTLLWLALATLAINVVLTTVLASSDGAEGAAVATVVGEVALALAGMVAVSRALGARIRMRTMARALAAAAAASALAAVGGVPSIVLALAAGGAYLAILWAIGGLPRDLVADLTPWRRGRPDH